MSKGFTRRDFIKISGLGVGALAAAGAVAHLTSDEDYERHEDYARDVTRSPMYCEMCTFKCAGWAYQKNGKPWKLIGNETDQHSYGRLCTKGSAGIGTYQDPDRLKNPLIRTSERGKQVFKEVSWDEALDYIAVKMKKIATTYGPEAMAMFTHGSGGSFFKTLLNAYGSNNIAAPSYSNCRGPREEAYMLTFGSAIDSPENTDMRDSQCIVLLGSHIGENSHSAQVNEFAQAVRKGATIITVDPRFSVAASKSKYWLPVKPGTDMALLLAWIQVILQEELYQKEYVTRYTTGLEQLKTAVASYTPEWAYPITSIKPETIRATAREMAKHAPATLLHPGRHVVWYGDDTQRVRAGAILNGLLGSWGQKGGFYLASSPEIPEFPHPAYPKPNRSWQDLYPGQYQLANLALASGICQATIPGNHSAWNFKGWLVYGSNLIHTLPNPQKTIEAIQNLDLLVAVDILPSEITGWADVVLPENTYLERYDELRISPGRETQVALRMPAFPSLYNSKPAWWMAKELANKMNLGHYFPWKTIEEYLDTRLKLAGTSLEELKKVGVKVLPRETPLYIEKGTDFEFDTASKKIELYSTTLVENGFDGVPRYTAHGQAPEGFYHLLYGRSPSHSFGRTINNPLLAQLQTENQVWVHGDTAKEWGLKNGQYLQLENQDGVVSNRVRVKITGRVRPDCVFLVHGFGHTQQKMRQAYNKGAAVQTLVTRSKSDPIMGSQSSRGNFVTFKV